MPYIAVLIAAVICGLFFNPREIFSIARDMTIVVCLISITVDMSYFRRGHP